LYRVKESGGRGGGGRPEKERRRCGGEGRVRKDKVAGEGQGSTARGRREERRCIFTDEENEREDGMKIDRVGREKEGQNQSAEEKEGGERSGAHIRVLGGGGRGGGR